MFHNYKKYILVLILVLFFFYSSENLDEATQNYQLIEKCILNKNNDYLLEGKSQKYNVDNKCMKKLINNDYIYFEKLDFYGKKKYYRNLNNYEYIIIESASNGKFNLALYSQKNSSIIYSPIINLNKFLPNTFSYSNKTKMLQGYFSEFSRKEIVFTNRLDKNNKLIVTNNCREPYHFEIKYIESNEDNNLHASFLFPKKLYDSQILKETGFETNYFGTGFTILNIGNIYLFTEKKFPVVKLNEIKNEFNYSFDNEINNKLDYVETRSIKWILNESLKKSGMTQENSPLSYKNINGEFIPYTFKNYSETWNEIALSSFKPNGNYPGNDEILSKYQRLKFNYSFFRNWDSILIKKHSIKNNYEITLYSSKDKKEALVIGNLNINRSLITHPLGISEMPLSREYFHKNKFKKNIDYILLYNLENNIIYEHHKKGIEMIGIRGEILNEDLFVELHILSHERIVPLYYTEFTIPDFGEYI